MAETQNPPGEDSAPQKDDGTYKAKIKRYFAQEALTGQVGLSVIKFREGQEITDQRLAEKLIEQGQSVKVKTETVARVTTKPDKYVEVYVIPAMQQLQDEARLTIVRAHLTRLNNIYAQLDASIEDFSLREVKGIKFANDTEERLWGMYNDFVAKMQAALSIKANPQWQKHNASRPIIWR